MVAITSESVLRELLAVLDLASDSIILRTMDDRICYWNQGAERLYGWTKREAYGQESHTLFKTKFPEPLSVIRAKLLSGGKWEGHLDHVKKDGNRIIVASRWTLYRDEDGAPSKYVEINRDITERKRFRERLRRANDQLAGLIREGRALGEERLAQTRFLTQQLHTSQGMTQELDVLEALMMEREAQLMRLQQENDRLRERVQQLKEP